MKRYLSTLALTIGLAIVACPAHAGTLTPLHDLDLAEGFLPYPLIRAPDGTFYGTTYLGGALGTGVVFSYDTAGYRVLHQFSELTEGSHPEGPPATHGRLLYGTAFESPNVDGHVGYGIIWTIGTRDRQFSVLHVLAGDGSEGGGPKGTIIVDAQGRVLLTTEFGGKYGNGTLLRVDSDGTATVLHSFSSAEGASPSGLIADPEGTVYGSTSNGSQAGGCEVYAYTPTGQFQVLHRFAAKPAYECNLALSQADSAGNIFGSTPGDGAYNGTMFRLTHASGGYRLRVQHVFTNDADGVGANGEHVAKGYGILGAAYGKNMRKGQDGYGSIFALGPPDGTVPEPFATLYHFTNHRDGSFPIGAPIKTPDGALVGITQAGGAHDGGVIYSYQP